MPRVLHTTYFKVRHRVTGLFVQPIKARFSTPESFVWKTKGRLFRTKRDLRRFLDRHGEIPREWEIMPIELVQREDRLSVARVYYDMFLKRPPGSKSAERERRSK